MREPANRDGVTPPKDVSDVGGLQGGTTEPMGPDGKPATSPIEWVSTAAIFEPLPPVKWIVPELQLAPGRPGMLGGYSFSAKSLAAQSLALAVASGTRAWGRFCTVRGVVRHLDYEQGSYATRRRYQRLAMGHGVDLRDLDGRLQACSYPALYLDSADAEDAYMRACEGADLVIIDALRGATPTKDENDSSIRQCLDLLSRVSEKIGTAFVVIHHSGKPQKDQNDNRTKMRGSSAIFDACGCVYVMHSPGKTDPKKTEQAKQPAEADGCGVDAFELQVEDVPVSDVARDGGAVLYGADDRPLGPVRVVHRPIEAEDPEQADARANDALKQRIITFLRGREGASKNKVETEVTGNATKLRKVLDVLVEDGQVVRFEGPNGAQCHRLAIGQ